MRDFVKPVIVLTAICLLISGVLAAGNDIMRPVIEQAALARAEAARKEIMPNAEGFELLEIEGLPRAVTGVYGTDNNIGYVFMVTSAGYGGDIKLICAIAPDGRIIRTMTLSHTETKGIADPVFDMERMYTGKDRNLEGIDAVSGATITSKAYMNGIRDAFEAFDAVKGRQ